MEGATRVFTSIGSIVGAVVALGGLIGAIGRLSQVPRARRRVLRAAELEGQAPSSLREKYAALHKEESARYLALVEARIDREPVATAVAAIFVVVFAFVILVMMAWNAGNPHVWSEALPIVIPFAVAYVVFLWMVLEKASASSAKFVQLYLTHVGPNNTETPDPGKRIDKLARKLGSTEAANRVLLAVTTMFSVLLLAGIGHTVGRNFTENGRAMKEAEEQWIGLAIPVAIIGLLFVLAASVALLFPKQPRHGESLRAGTIAESDPPEPVDGDRSRAPDTGPSASVSPPAR